MGDTLFTCSRSLSGPAGSAAERTVRIFEAAFPQLSQYDPLGSSMYMWLIRHAESLYPKETPPRPQSLLQVLRALGSIVRRKSRNSLPENPASIGLFQAALTEMDEDGTMVLLPASSNRSKGSAGTGSQSSSDSLGDHGAGTLLFSRYLLAWIYSCSPTSENIFSDSGSTGFEENLEKSSVLFPGIKTRNPPPRNWKKTCFYRLSRPRQPSNPRACIIPQIHMESCAAVLWLP